MDPLNESLQDLSEDANKKCDFLVAHIFNDLMSMKMAVHDLHGGRQCHRIVWNNPGPCATGSPDLIRASLFTYKIFSQIGITLTFVMRPLRKYA